LFQISDIRSFFIFLFSSNSAAEAAVADKFNFCAPVNKFR
jgi:hypothetical protein